MCPSSSQPLPSLSHLNPASSSFSVSPSIHTPNPPPSLTNTHKTISSKTNPPKTTTNNPTYPPNNPQLIFTYPPLASSTPPPQIQHTISPLNPLSILPPPLETTSESYSGMLMGFALVVLKSCNSSLINSTISSSYKSRTSPDSTFRIPGYKTLQKNQDKERNHQLYGKPRRWRTHTCQKRSNLHFTLHTIPLLPRSQLRLFSYRR